jgi:DNA-binding NarL/FixJ family response regulator
MNVLIIEDDENKRLQLKQFLDGLLPRVTCRLARSLQSGIRALREKRPELVILDMTLPNFDAGPDEPGGQIYPLGGREFLEQMARFDITVPVIVVTQFETFGKGSRQLNIGTLDQQLRRDYSNVYKGTVYYHAAIHGWKEDLAKSIKELDNEGKLGLR